MQSAHKGPRKAGQPETGNGLARTHESLRGGEGPGEDSHAVTNTAHSKPKRTSRLRRRIGAGFFAAGLALVAWLPLGALNVVPFVLNLHGESPLRTHAAAAVGCLLIAAWAYRDR